MRTDGNELTEPAGRIADGEAVDWEAERRQAPQLERELAALSRVARIAEGWRAVGVAPAADDSGGADEPVLLRWGPLEGREKLGEGAFGEVWRAWDPSLRREVALKLRRAGGDESSVRRELEEARRLARVRHPNVLAIHGVDVHDGRAGLWTDLVHGRTLEQLLAERGVLGAHEAAGVGCDLCRALAAVHAAGLVHGDIKAANVMREDGGRIVLMDFGSGRDAGSAADAGVVTASPLASAPELLRGEAPTPSSDLYALGVLLFRLVSGRYPIEAGSLEQLRARHDAGTRARLRTLRPELPTAFVTAVERALDPASARRYADAGAFELALAAASGGAAGALGGRTRAPRERRGAWLVGAVVAIAAAILAWQALHRTPAVEPAPASAPTSSSAPAAPRAGAGAGAIAPGAVANASAPSPVVTVTLWRGREGVRTAVADGDPVRPGDHLWLDYRGDEPLHVYVLDEDDGGQTFALFPIAGTDLANPLRARAATRLPGTRGGTPFDWVVTSAGGHERLLIVASRKPLAVLEDLLASVPAAAPGEPVAYAQVPDGAIAALRGIGGLAPSAANEREGRLASVERALGSRAGAGLWLRHIVLAAH